MRMKLAAYDPDPQRLRRRMNQAMAILRSLGAYPQGYGDVRPQPFLETLRRTAVRRDLLVLLPGDREGLVLGEHLRAWDRESVLIFVGGPPELTLSAFSRLPIAFVIRESEMEEPARVAETSSASAHTLTRALADALRWLEGGWQIYRRISKQMVCQVPLDQVDFFESSCREVILHRADGEEVQFPAKLDDVEQELDPGAFCRCHRSYLVRLAAIETVQRRERRICFRSGAVAYASKAMMPALLTALKGSFPAGTGAI